MKSILALLLTLNILNASAGTESSGGGVTFSVTETSFVDVNHLQQTGVQAIELVMKSALPEKVKESFKHDLSHVLKYHEMYIKMVPAVFSVGFNRYQGDYRTLMGHCSFTMKKTEDLMLEDQSIYISSVREECYGSRLIEVLIHETFHHVLSKYLNPDEAFVDRLTAEVIKQDVSVFVQRSFKKAELLEDAFRRSYEYLAKNELDARIYPGCVGESGDGNPFAYSENEGARDEHEFYIMLNSGCDAHYAVIVRYDYLGNLLSIDHVDA